ncbi:hypothetical protein BRC96_03280 [Halobacteriales archaeon QS_6_64_34]|nr:MAG: hypothetical protein BRC96_03280 [Halobacteriales archaeon QS_6_64_34]
MPGSLAQFLDGQWLGMDAVVVVASLGPLGGAGLAVGLLGETIAPMAGVGFLVVFAGFAILSSESISIPFSGGPPPRSADYVDAD